VIAALQAKKDGRLKTDGHQFEEEWPPVRSGVHSQTTSILNTTAAPFSGRSHYPSHTRWITAACNNGRDRARLMFGFHCRKRPRDPVCDPRQKRGQKRLTDFLDDLHGLILRVAGRGGVQLSPNLGLRTILANE